MENVLSLLIVGIKIIIGIFIIVYTPYYFISPFREMIWISYLTVLYKLK